MAKKLSKTEDFLKELESTKSRRSTLSKKERNLEDTLRILEIMKAENVTIDDLRRVFDYLLQEVTKAINVLRQENNSAKTDVLNSYQTLSKKLETDVKKYLPDIEKSKRKGKDNFNLIKQAFREIKDVTKELSKINEVELSLRDEFQEQFENFEDSLARLKESIPELDTPFIVRDKLESLKGDDRLEKEAIKGLTEDLLNLDTRVSSIQISESNRKIGGLKWLPDVSINGDPTNGQALVYDSALGKWKPDTISGGSGSVSVNSSTVSNPDFLDSSEIEFDVTGSNITLSLVAGSIDETKLDTSVNASLDLADSALQNITSENLADLSDVTAPLAGDDEKFLKYDHDTLTYVWATPAGGGGGTMDSFTLGADSGTPQTIEDGNTLTIAGGTGIDSVVGATDTVTLNLDSATIASLALADTALQPSDNISELTNDSGYITSSSLASFGTDNQIPYTNSGGTDFDYSANLTFDGTDLAVNTDDLFVDGSTGNVGIGTDSPTQLVHIQGVPSSGADPLLLVDSTDTTNGRELMELRTAAQSGSLRFSNDNEFWRWFIGSSGEMRFDSNDGVGKFYISNDGRVAVGDIGPDYKFETNGTAGNGYLGVTNVTDGDIFNIDSSGNVGIGTTDPAQVLHVVEATNPTIRLSETATPTSYFDIGHQGPTQTTLDAYNAGAGSALIDFNPLPSDGTSTASFRFFRATNTTGTVGFSIHAGDGTATTNTFFGGNTDSYLNTASGLVGIGTASPSAKLHTISTAEQLRLGYDASNYLSATVASTGDTTFNLEGTTPEFTFSDAVNVPDEAYGSGWNASTQVPTKNAVYDKIETLQPLDAGLTSIAGLTTLADRMIYTTASDTYAVATLTSAARSILDDASTSAIRTTLGVGTAQSPQFAGVNVGNASDTTITRVSAGTIAVEGVTVATSSNTLTFTNKSGNISQWTNDSGYLISSTLDGSYDGSGSGAGRTITADSGAVEITVPDTSNNTGLIINQNDVTNSPNALIINSNVGSLATTSAQHPLLIKSTSESNIGGFIGFYHDSASPAAQDQIGGFGAFGNNSADEETNYGGFGVLISDTTDASEDGFVSFYAMQGGTVTTLFRVGDGVSGISVGSTTSPGVVESRGDTDLTLRTGNSTTGSITITDGANGDITLAPNGTGAVVIDGSIEYDTAVGTVSALGNLGATETIDWSTGTHFTGTLDSDVTITHSNETSGQKITLVLSYSGAQRTITWSDVDAWTGGTEPTAPDTGETLIVTLMFIGTTCYGSYELFS